MIQRKQSLFLFLVILLSVLLFIPAAAPISFVNSATSKEFDITLNVLGIYTRCLSIKEPASYIGLIVLNSLIILFSTLTVFKFKNRPMQIKLCYITSVFVLFLMGGMWLYTDLMKHKTANPQSVYLIGFYLPLIQIALLYMAAMAIRKDDQLVKSTDRLR